MAKWQQIAFWMGMLPLMGSFLGSLSVIASYYDTVSYLLTFLMTVDPETGMTGTQQMEAILNEWKNSRYN